MKIFRDPPKNTIQKFRKLEPRGGGGAAIPTPCPATDSDILYDSKFHPKMMSSCTRIEEID